MCKSGSANMPEIGGYLELERYHGSLYHDDALLFNCARNALAYVIIKRNIKKLLLPYFLCGSVKHLCEAYGVCIRQYEINEDFTPKNITQEHDEWLYVVNFYGQVDMESVCGKYERVIADQSQAFFCKKVEGVDNIYSARKFFGVPDGAFLYTDLSPDDSLSRDVSFDRMRHILGRFEMPASLFYNDHVANDKSFEDSKIKRMSKLSENLLRAVDFEFTLNRRTDNYRRLTRLLKDINLLKLKSIDGAYAYPLLIKNGARVRKKLIDNNIYVPTLWGNVLSDSESGFYLEKYYAENILPLPCDQRYGVGEMDYIFKEVLECME